jgi:hypothetical protein
LELRAIDLWDLVQELEALKKMMAESKPQESVDGKDETLALGGVVKSEPQNFQEKGNRLISRARSDEAI